MYILEMKITQTVVSRLESFFKKTEDYIQPSSMIFESYNVSTSFVRISILDIKQ